MSGDGWNEDEVTERLAVPGELMDDMHARDPKPTGHSWSGGRFEDHGTVAGYGKGPCLLKTPSKG